MPRDIVVPVYKFSELPDKVKERVKQKYAQNFNWDRADEYMNSLKKLAEHFGGKLAHWEVSWDGGSYSNAKFSMPEMEPDEIEEKLSELSGEECKLTGAVYDEDAIDGFRNAWDGGETDLDKLMQAAFRKWLKSAQGEYEADFSDEVFGENCDANERWFYADGSLAPSPEDPPPNQGRYAPAGAPARASGHESCGGGMCWPKYNGYQPSPCQWADA